MPSAPPTSHETLVSLSRQKWAWMSAQDTDPLGDLFHDSAVFVHMGATFTKEQELDVIRTGTIRYRQVDVHDVSVRTVGSTAVVLTTLDLHAVVGGNEVVNPFVVTEVFAETAGRWHLVSMSFTRLVTS